MTVTVGELRDALGRFDPDMPVHVLGEGPVFTLYVLVAEDLGEDNVVLISSGPVSVAPEP